jgi:hypothetical protein
MAKRTIESYSGFQIVAAFYKGKYQGRAHGERQFSAEGTDIKSVVANLKRLVDSWNINRESILAKEREERHRVLAKEREERHRAFLKARNVLYQGVRETNKPRLQRVTHCWSCKGHLDNSINVECVACGWILCDCGACGCGYHAR